MEKLVARTYAEALYEVAVEGSQLDRFGEELQFIRETFEQYPEFYALYKTPQISSSEKKKIMDEVFKDKISNEVMNFLKILLDKRRTAAFEDIIKEYQRLANAHNNIVEAVAITTVPLTDEDKAKLVEKLSNMTGKVVKLKNEIDHSILGGMLVRIGDKVIDGTIQSRLKELQENLAQIIV